MSMTLCGTGTAWLTAPPSLSAAGLVFGKPVVTDDSRALVDVSATLRPMLTLLTDGSSGAFTVVSIQHVN